MQRKHTKWKETSLWSWGMLVECLCGINEDLGSIPVLYHPNMVAHTGDPNTWLIEVGGPEVVWGQSQICEILSKNKQKQTETKAKPSKQTKIQNIL